MMKNISILLLVAVLASSCLKSLDAELNSNPLDPSYGGEYVILDGYSFESKMGPDGEECTPLVRFHINPAMLDELKKIDLTDYDLRLYIKLKRTSTVDGTVQNKVFPIKKLSDYVLDSVYTLRHQPSPFLHDPDDILCPEFYLTFRCLSCPPSKPYTGESGSQFLECFRCGG